MKQTALLLLVLLTARGGHPFRAIAPTVARRCDSSKVGVSTLFGSLPSRSASCRALRATIEDTAKTTGIGSSTDEDPTLVPGLQDDSENWPYDWRKQWYSVGYEADFPMGEKPFGVSIFDEPLVIYRDGDGHLQCVSDFCPHRASKLSEGMVTDGNIECLYHGWQFNGKDGKCIHIPQLPEGASPPRAANLRVYPVAVSEGVVFVWMGEDAWGEGAKHILPVPRSAENLDENTPDWTYDFTYELPYDWSYLVENLLDPAHIPISHHATQGGGDRKHAGPINFELFKEGPKAPSPRGFNVRVRTKSLTKDGDWGTQMYTFEAPGIVRMRSENVKEGGFRFGAALHATPLGKGRSRLMFRTFVYNMPFALKVILKTKLLAMRHLNSCKILEQDMALICAQEDHVARTGKPLSESFLPIKSSDTMVVELRKWLDHVGHGMPHFTGWKKLQAPDDLSDHESSRLSTHRSRESRFFRHVVLSDVTRTFLARLKRVKHCAITSAAVFAAVAMLTCTVLPPGASVGGSASIFAGSGVLESILGKGLKRRGLIAVCSAVASACTLGLSAAANKLESHFYTNFERHPVLGFDREVIGTFDTARAIVVKSTEVLDCGGCPCNILGLELHYGSLECFARIVERDELASIYAWTAAEDPQERFLWKGPLRSTASPLQEGF